MTKILCSNKSCNLLADFQIKVSEDKRGYKLQDNLTKNTLKSSSRNKVNYCINHYLPNEVNTYLKQNNPSIIISLITQHNNSLKLHCLTIQQALEHNEKIIHNDNLDDDSYEMDTHTDILVKETSPDNMSIDSDDEIEYDFFDNNSKQHSSSELDDLNNAEKIFESEFEQLAQNIQKQRNLSNLTLNSPDNTSQASDSDIEDEDIEMNDEQHFDLCEDIKNILQTSHTYPNSKPLAYFDPTKSNIKNLENKMIALGANSLIPEEVNKLLNHYFK